MTWDIFSCQPKFSLKATDSISTGAYSVWHGPVFWWSINLCHCIQLLARIGRDQQVRLASSLNIFRGWPAGGRSARHCWTCMRKRPELKLLSLRPATYLPQDLHRGKLWSIPLRWVVLLVIFICGWQQLFSVDYTNRAESMARWMGQHPNAFSIMMIMSMHAIIK